MVTASSPMVVLGGATVSYDRGTPVLDPTISSIGQTNAWTMATALGGVCEMRIYARDICCTMVQEYIADKNPPPPIGP